MIARSFTEASPDHENEDALFVGPHPGDPEVWLCFVADGQGGRPNGGPAARLAVRVACEAACEQDPKALFDPFIWTELLARADEAVREDAGAGFTTLVGLCASRDRVVGASSGDSAALLASAGEIVELTGKQYKNPPIGAGGAAIVPFGASLGDPWQILAMTDGVWKYVGWRLLFDLAARERGDALIEALQRPARLPGSGRFPDDFTIVALAAAGR